MPIIVDNNFSRDSHNIRTERLSAIQGNFASIQTELSAPAEIATWAEDCYDIYAELWTNSGVENDQSESATLDFNTKLDLMEEEYQNAKMLANSIYVDNPVLLKQFEFDMAFPDRRGERIDKARKVLKTHQNHVADGVTTLLPAAIITRLTNAIDNAEEARWTQDKERGEWANAVAAMNDVFDADTKMLNKLKSWWLAMLGKEDPRITMIGMVNPKSGGGSHKLPAPTGLAFSYELMNLSWNAVVDATSYELEADIGSGFVEIYSGEDTQFAYTPQDGKTLYRVRARDANGYGDYSAILEQYYFAVLPAPTNFDVVNVQGVNYHFSWDNVETAMTYNIFVSDVNIGEPAGEYVNFMNTGFLTLDTTLAGGRYMYFKVRAANIYQPAGEFTEPFLVETNWD